MATENDVVLPPARWAIKLGKWLGLPIWLITAILGLVAVAAFTWLGFLLVDGVGVIGHKWLVASGTIIVTVSGLIAVFGETEKVGGRRQVQSASKAGDAAKVFGYGGVFLGGFILSAVAVMDAFGRF